MPGYFTGNTGESVIRLSQASLNTKDIPGADSHRGTLQDWRSRAWKMYIKNWRRALDWDSLNE